MLTDRDEMSKLYRGPSIDASYQCSVHLASDFRGDKKWPFKNKNCLWRPCLLMNRDKIIKLYRGHSKDVFHKVLIHLARRFQRGRFFRNQPTRNKNGLCRPCLLTDRDEMSNLYRGPSVDASCQVSVHLAKRFQR